ncbi:MAG: protein translocase subunit SecF [Bifidobacteriaceae bacterium]|jgi:preprotein translocase subunit SecF|nr:protein translocase subunit SecF [Bifidobacteriaceae bacterium]
MAKGFSFSQWGNDLYTGRRSYKVVPKIRIWLGVAAAVLVVCTVLLFKPGPQLGMEFVGGTEFRVSGTSSTDQGPALDVVHDVLGGDSAPKITSLGDGGVRVQIGDVTADQTQSIRNGLAEAYDVETAEVSNQMVAASWGTDVSGKALRGSIIFLALVAVAMILYFRNWAMAVSAITALIHDLLVTVGVYVVVGFEVTPATLIGFLTVLGYSMYDTVVVFDKVRENTEGVLDQSQYTYGEAANLAVNQTMVRSINTSVVALLPVGAILFIGWALLGPSSLQDISLALFVGMAAGTYSSIFLATPLEVALRNRQASIREHTARVLAKRAAAIASGADAGMGTAALAGIGAMKAGEHRGHEAQPRRKARSER